MLLDVDESERFIQSCKDIPVGLSEVLSKDYVEWNEKCYKRGRVTL